MQFIVGSDALGDQPGTSELNPGQRQSNGKAEHAGDQGAKAGGGGADQRNNVNLKADAYRAQQNVKEAHEHGLYHKLP